jgi:hypothetical protein
MADVPLAECDDIPRTVYRFFGVPLSEVILRSPLSETVGVAGGNIVAVEHLGLVKKLGRRGEIRGEMVQEGRDRVPPGLPAPSRW